MNRAGVRELRDHLSEYLRRARRGERIVITDRGEPVAALIGVETTAAEELSWELVGRGIGEWEGGKPRGSTVAPRIPGRRAEEIVLEDRR